MDSEGLSGREFPEVVLHIPHASTRIPEEWASLFLADEDSLAEELLRRTDAFTDDLFDLAGADRVVFPVSRLLVDPERFADDAEEPMAAKGMGAVYVKTHRGTSIKDASAREELMEAYYWPHHSRFTQTVGERLVRFGRCLIVDAHSYPSRPLPCDLDPIGDRPDICIGTDAFHTPPELVRMAVQAFERQGYSVMVDRPYRGTIVPSSYWRKDARAQSVMVELNRALYMDEQTGAQSAGYAECKLRVGRALREVVEGWLDWLCSTNCHSMTRQSTFGKPVLPESSEDSLASPCSP